MRKKIFTFLLALVASVGMSWATDPIVIATNTGQSSYTQGSITVSVGNVGDSDGFRLNDDNPASISNSGSSTISKIELVPGWFLNKHSYVRANGAEPNSSSEELITFLNVNSNEVTLSCSVSIYIKEVRIYFEEPEPAGNVKLIEFQVPASWENDNSPVSSADFPDFVATTYEIASALPVTSEPSLVVFDFPGDDEVSVYSKMGGQVSKASTGAIKREAFFENTQVHYYYPVLDGDEPEPQIGPKEVLDLGTTGCVGEHYQLTGGGTNTYRTVGGVDNKMITIESLHGEIIDNISLKLYYYNVWTGYSVAASSGDVSSWNYDAYEDLVITNINATSVTLSRVGSGQANGYVMFEKVTINNSDEPQPQPANPSGSCGENLTWEFNTETGALTISGTGAMTSASWGTYKEDITSLSLPDGLTAIPSEAFKGCTGLTTVTIPASVTSIGADAFHGCESVTDVYCYPKAADLDWDDYYTDDFIEYPAIETRCHVFADEYLEYIARYSQGDGVNVTFMNDLEAVAVSTNEDPQNAGAVYYSTYYNSAKKYILPAGCEAYTALLSGDALTLTKIAVGGQTIPNGAAVILKSGSASVTLLPTETDPVPYNAATNSLQGVDDAIATPATNCYVLSGEDGVVGFYRYTASMLNPHKAYVIYSGSQAPKRMPFIFDQATGVESVQPSAISSQKVIENGQLFIIKNGVKYNAQGQVVK